MSEKFQRSSSTYYNVDYQYTAVINKAQNGGGRMRGAPRIIILCLLTSVLPTIFIIIPLYLRNYIFADVMYKISDSDVIQIHKGQSSIFCEKHSITMNTSFNAFQMKGRPELSTKRRHITLRKSMSLPDDTLEYWGFYLFSGATVELKGCSRVDGSKIMVVRGEKIFNTCGILEGRRNKKDAMIREKNHHLLVTVENPKEKKEANSSKDFSTGYNLDVLNVHNKKVENYSKSHFKSIHKRDISKHNIHKKTGLPIHNPNTVLDTGVNHGGNADINDDDKSMSSFENSLHECYNDNILLSDIFPYSIQCNNTKYLEQTTILKAVHEVTSDGYYYYIFYSDNNLIKNDVHVIFDIYKPTFQYSNISDDKMCLNKTECDFDVKMFSDELVIVEVPTRDGFTNDGNDAFILVSVCHPRSSVYIFFPISVILLILLASLL